jgi:single-strand DNA-binding protein
MQQITIAGNVGKDAATRQVNGQSVTEWSVGVSAGRDAPTTWFKCYMWGSRGEKLASYITKGSKITVVGRLTVGVYDGKPNCKIDVSEVALQGSKSEGERPASGTNADNRQRFGGGHVPRPQDDDLDDMPFVTAIGREPGESKRRV